MYFPATAKPAICWQRYKLKVECKSIGGSKASRRHFDLEL